MIAIHIQSELSSRASQNFCIVDRLTLCTMDAFDVDVVLIASDVRSGSDLNVCLLLAGGVGLKDILGHQYLSTTTSILLPFFTVKTY